MQPVDIWTFKEKDAAELCKTSRFHHPRLHTQLRTPANTVGECDTRRHCGASEAAQHAAQRRAEILKSLGETQASRMACVISWDPHPTHIVHRSKQNLSGVDPTHARRLVSTIMIKSRCA